jgi:uncharacterized protein
VVSDAVLTVAGETLRLLAERAVYWPREHTLFIADIHIGKSATHGAFGRPLPRDDTLDDLSRLTKALERTDAAHLVILGDLLHAAPGRDTLTVRLVEQWREAHRRLRITLVRGNHDRGADVMRSWRIDVVDGPHALPPFVLDHVPRSPEAGYGLGGHLHPGVELTGRGRQVVRLPCFWFRAQSAVLPAFGRFTGIAVIEPAPDDRLYAITDTSVIEVSGPLGDGTR